MIGDIEKMMKLKKLAEEVLGGKEGAADLLIIEAPSGRISSQDEVMGFAEETLADSEHEDIEEMDVEEEPEEGPEGPLHEAVHELIAVWQPESDEGKQYKDDLQQVYDANKHMGSEHGY